jgi:hypothetical protein
MVNWKGFGRKRSWPNEVLSQHLAGLRNTTNTVSVAGVSVGIRTEDLSNESLEQWYLNFFGSRRTVKYIIIFWPRGRLSL